MTDILQQDIQYMPGVGPNRKKMLSQELGSGSFHRWYREGDGPDMVQWWEICQAEL